MFKNSITLIWGFQDAATPIMEGIVDLHNYIFFFLVLVLLVVIWFLLNILYYFFYKINYELNEETIKNRYLFMSGNKITHGTILEIVWTSIPSIVLIAIAIPSFALLYSMDEVVLPGIILKAIGHQWYWSYEYANHSFKKTTENNTPFSIKKTDKNKFNFSIFKKSPETVINFSNRKIDSYMISEADLKFGNSRLLETDTTIILPQNVHVKLIVTSTDVLHSWAVPSLGVKIDAVPGRLNQANFFSKMSGTYYGQCSEICGVNHGFMPIFLKIIKINEYIDLYGTKKIGINP